MARGSPLVQPLLETRRRTQQRGRHWPYIIGAVPEKASVAGAVMPQPTAVPVASSVNVGTLFTMAQATLPEVKVATTEPQLWVAIAGQAKLVDHEHASAAPDAVTE